MHEEGGRLDGRRVGGLVYLQGALTAHRADIYTSSAPAAATDAATRQGFFRK